jgi:hypothetical protein
MGAIKDKYLELLDLLTVAGRDDRAKPEPLPTDQQLWERARGFAAAIDAEGLLAEKLDKLEVVDLRDAYNEGRLPDRLNFDQVSTELAKLGIESEVEHTSGGCATLFAGPKADWCDDNGQRPRCVSLGPGSFSEERSGVLCGAYGLTYEMSYGDVDGESESGESVPDGAMPADVAAGIAAIVRQEVARRQRLEIAVEKACEGMWDAVSRAYPEVTTGDFGPGETLTIEQAIRGAVKLWLHYNRPDEGLAPTLQAAHQIVEVRREQAIERLTPLALVVAGQGSIALPDMLHDASCEYMGVQMNTRDFTPLSDDHAERGLREYADHRIEQAVTVPDMVAALVDFLGDWRAEKILSAVELNFDQVEQLGLDGTGRDGDERFPYTVGNLTDAERERLIEDICRCGNRIDGGGDGETGMCGSCADAFENELSGNA